VKENEVIGNVAGVVDKRNAYSILMGKPEETNRYEGQDVCWWMILKWVLENQDRVVLTRLM
jgi:hypothetical protein